MRLLKLAELLIEWIRKLVLGRERSLLERVCLKLVRGSMAR